MRTSTRLTLLPIISLVSLLSGCATFPIAQPPHQAAPSVPNHSAQPSNSTGQGNLGALTQAIDITRITQTNSEVSFVFNQPIQDVHILSGDAALLVNQEANSITFKRSPSANVVITALVSTRSSVKRVVTLHVPQASGQIAPATNQSTNSTADSLSSSNSTQTLNTSSSQSQSSNTINQASNTSTGGNNTSSGVSTSVASSNAANGTTQSNSSHTTKPVIPVHAGKSAKLIYFGPSTGRRIYITVDDGWQPSQRVLSLMQQQHVPITAFLIQQAAAENLSYWKAFVAAGGVIQDHTVSHPWLTNVSYKTDLSQWQGPLQTFPKWFGQTPTLGRPPYGAVDKNVLVSAHDSGLQAVVMWSAEFNPNKPSAGLETWNGKPLGPGDIVLLHWQPGLYNQIQQVLAICKQQNLVPAPLVLNPS